MVTATTGTMTFKGLQSGRTYSVGCYISDVVAAKVTFNMNGAAGAGSDAFWQAPENVQLVDVAIITGPTVAVGFSYFSGGASVPGSSTLISPNLTTNASRSSPNIGFRSQSFVTAVQF